MALNVGDLGRKLLAEVEEVGLSEVSAEERRRRRRRSGGFENTSSVYTVG